jgi:hypothetical protein
MMGTIIFITLGTIVVFLGAVIYILNKPLDEEELQNIPKKHIGPAAK